jgi:phosphinothricin acetyltransferase
MSIVRAAVEADLPALTAIYNHYVLNTAITFDVTPFAPGERREWFESHAPTGRHRLLVADGPDGIVGYASTSRWRPKPAYQTTVEASVYCRADALGQGVGTLLYRSLFEAIATEDVHQIVAGVALPNEASLALHRRLGFRAVGVFSGVGHKFDRFWDVAWLQRPLELG